MKNEKKYMTLIVESFPFGWETKYFYKEVKESLYIGDVITHKSGKQYRVIDGKTQLNLSDIDLDKYQLFDE